MSVSNNELKILLIGKETMVPTVIVVKEIASFNAVYNSIKQK